MSSKSEMVGVRLPPEDVSAIDLLVEGGVFKTRSEAICSILHQALQVIPIAKMAPKLQEIKKLREEATIELTDLGKQMRKHTVEAFGEEYVLKKPYVGVEGDSEGYIGLDSEKMELVTNYGKTRVPL
ncbi:MAG: hypothetical protein FJ045_06440, partial [Crenarchaeota archaeon]|nr:hypothetical protein [Thermoproteota archaeon]